ncbi:hypothetical protein O3G_MSEX009847 [Manduca sexta]|uniref:Uncharacterized protein n=1 Tax=Manduca sexta TaxID=7130 RepID=A0A922CRD2_MANSE|nr:hypothetical protein O3G_MSEX009847 [Manduca sexta]
MAKRTNIIIASVIGALVIGAGLGILIWWLVTDKAMTDDGGIDDIDGSGDGADIGDNEYDVTELSGDGLGDIPYTAAYTNIRGAGNMFWWFYPTTSPRRSTTPLIVWLDGVTGVPPSLLANFGMFGPYDINMNVRNESWVEQYSLLFIDSPLGTGYSTLEDGNISTNLDQMTNHLIYTLKSFYSLHKEYLYAPLYIFGQGHGAQQAVSLAAKLKDIDHLAHLPTGVVIGNGIISPALALTKLGFYLEELGYIDGNGRSAVENISNIINKAVNEERFGEAFDRLLSLGKFVNENAGAVAVNLGHIVEKLTQESLQDPYNQRQFMKKLFGIRSINIMDEVIRPALGIPNSIKFDGQNENALRAVRSTFMIPAVDKVEYLLQNTNVSVTIYNGNLDAVSNTPGIYVFSN